MGRKTVAIKSWLKGTAVGTWLRRRRWNAALLNENETMNIVNKYTAGGG